MAEESAARAGGVAFPEQLADFLIHSVQPFFVQLIRCLVVESVG